MYFKLEIWQKFDTRRDLFGPFLSGSIIWYQRIGLYNSKTHVDWVLFLKDGVHNDRSYV